MRGALAWVERVYVLAASTWYLSGTRCLGGYLMLGKALGAQPGTWFLETFVLGPATHTADTWSGRLLVLGRPLVAQASTWCLGGHLVLEKDPLCSADRQIKTFCRLRCVLFVVLWCSQAQSDPVMLRIIVEQHYTQQCQKQQ